MWRVFFGLLVGVTLAGIVLCSDSHSINSQTLVTCTDGSCETISEELHDKAKIDVDNEPADQIKLSKMPADWQSVYSILVNLNFNDDQCLRSREDAEIYGEFVNPVPYEVPMELVDFNFQVASSVLGLNLPKVQFNTTKQEEIQELIDLLSGKTIPVHSKPYAQRYGGYQFGYWAGQLGDGRATSWGRVEVPVPEAQGYHYYSASNSWDWQLKGSGPTAFSRGGDGRAVLRSSIREYLGSWALYNLGVPTSLCLSVSKTTIPLIERDPLENGNHILEQGAVTLRVSPSWLRFGTFEYLYKTGQEDALMNLLNYAIEQHFPHLIPKKAGKIASRGLRGSFKPYADLLDEVTKSSAKLVAHWQAVGFCHGVLNTDNMSILGLTIDFGPFQFMERYDSQLVCNLSDDTRRYRFIEQPSVVMWNIRRFADSLTPFVDVTTQTKIITQFYQHYKPAYTELMQQKLGLTNATLEVVYTVAEAILEILEMGRVDYNGFFRILLANAHHKLIPEPIEELFAHDSEASMLMEAWWKFYQMVLVQQNLPMVDVKRAMSLSNPLYVLRNHLAQEAIQLAELGDYSQVQLWRELLSKPFSMNHDITRAESRRLSTPLPKGAQPVLVSCSS